MEFKTEFNELNDSYLMDNGSNVNGYHQNVNQTDERHSLSPTGNNGMNRSRSRSYSRSRSPRNRNNLNNSEYNNNNNNNNEANYRGDNNRQPRRDAFNRNNNNNNNNNRYASQSRLSDKDLGLKYRWEKTVFVNNIPYDVKWPELKDLFRSKIGEIHFCEIFERDGKSLGVGTIEFKLIEDAEKAVELMNQYDMGTRKIAVRMDTDGSKTRKAKEMTRDFSRQTYSNDNQQQQQQQQQQSSILSALSSTNILAALGLGNNNPGASSALNSQNILGLLTTLGSSGAGGGSGGSAASSSNSTQLAMLNQIAAQHNIEGSVTCRVFVASLDYKVDEHKIKEVFQLAGKVHAVSLFKDRDGKSRGMSVVEYATPAEALNACLMFNNQVLNNRTMNVRFDTKPPPKEDEPQSSQRLPSGLKSIGFGLGLGLSSLQQQKTVESSNPIGLDALSALTGMSSSNSGNLNNLSALAGLAGLTGGNGNLGLSNLLGSFSQQGNKSMATSTISKIFIKNIPFSWDERRLKEKFRQAGPIEFVEIKHRDGKSRGCGLIKFSTPDQALKAVELFNGSRFEGRTLEVKLDQLSS